MASLRVQLKKLEHKGNITKEQLQELMDKLDGHDKQIKINVLNEFTEYFLSTDCLHTDCPYVGECLDRCTPCLINKFKEQKI